MPRLLALITTAALSASSVTADPPTVPAAPATGFDTKREKAPAGKVETNEYDSATVGGKRKFVIYTPPGYTKEKKYPVLYLLHGIGDNETGWSTKGAAGVILDNLAADQKVLPMVVVMPNGRSSKTLTEKSPWGEQTPAFALFEKELLNDIIPFVEKNYSVKADRESRALFGLSMGGGQSLNFGLSHLDTFAWVGGFSSAPNTRPVSELVTDPADAAKKLKLLWVSCGDTDSLLNISKKFHEDLTAKKVPHVWYEEKGAHTWPVWKNDLYLIAQLLFREVK